MKMEKQSLVLYALLSLIIVELFAVVLLLQQKPTQNLTTIVRYYYGDLKLNEHHALGAINLCIDRITSQYNITKEELLTNYTIMVSIIAPMYYYDQQKNQLYGFSYLVRFIKRIAQNYEINQYLCYADPVKNFVLVVK